MAKKPTSPKTSDEAQASTILGAVDTPVKKKGENVRVFYIDDKGALHKSAMPESPSGLRVQVGKGEDGTFGAIGSRDVVFSELPASIQRKAMAFGLRTAAQNAVNTAADTAEGWDAFERRFGNFAKDVWATAGGGEGATPMFLLAFERALTDAGKAKEVIDASVAKWAAKYEEAGNTDDEKLARKQQNAVRAEIMSAKVVEAAMITLQQEALAKRQSKLNEAKTGVKEVSLDDL